MAIYIPSQDADTGVTKTYLQQNYGTYRWTNTAIASAVTGVENDISAEVNRATNAETLLGTGLTHNTVGGTTRLTQVTTQNIHSDSDLTLSGNNVICTADPTDANHVATKSYVDSIAVGLTWKNACRLKTVAPLPSYTKSGQNYTATTNGILSIDGVECSSSDRVLLDQNLTAPQDGGIFVVTSPGSVSTPWVLRRATDAVQLPPGMAVAVTEGSTCADKQYTLVTDPPIVVGTTALQFAQFGANQVTLAGDVTGASSSNTVATIGGSTAANVHSAEVLANAATSSATPNTLVKRDGTGAFSGVCSDVLGSAVLGKVLTGYTAGSGTVSSSDTILSAIQKLGYNASLYGSGFRYYCADSNGVGQSAANGSNTALQFPTVRSNSFGSALTVSGTGNNTFTNSSGATRWYAISVVTRTNNSYTGMFNMWIQTTGTSQDGIYLGQVVGTDSNEKAKTIASTLQLPAGASFQALLFHNAGTTITVGGTGQYASSVITIADLTAIGGGLGQLTGDVTTSGSVATVASVGGSTASQVNTGVTLANAATASNTASAIVRRDASGDFITRDVKLRRVADQSGNVLLDTSTGTECTFVGVGAGNQTTTGSYNTCLGKNAGHALATVQNCTYLGNNTGGSSTGGNNTGVGAGCMTNTASSSCTAVDNGALNGVVTGGGHTCMGLSAGNTITSGTNNTCIGNGANVSTGTLSNATAIGAGAIVGSSNSIQLGNSSVATITTSATIATTGTVNCNTVNATNDVNCIGVSSNTLTTSTVNCATLNCSGAINGGAVTTLTGNWSGGLVVSSKKVALTRVGKLVTMAMEPLTVLASSTADAVFDQVIPSTLRPSSIYGGLRGPCWVQTGNATVTGYVTVATNGTISVNSVQGIYGDPWNVSVFQSGWQEGITLTWMID